MFPLAWGWVGRGGVVSKREEGRRGLEGVWENPGEGAEGLATRRPPSPRVEGEEPGGKKRWKAMRFDVRLTMYPVARSRGKAGVEGVGQWKVTVPVTWLRHGLALQKSSTTLHPASDGDYTVIVLVLDNGTGLRIFYSYPSSGKVTFLDEQVRLGRRKGHDRVEQ